MGLYDRLSGGNKQRGLAGRLGGGGAPAAEDPLNPSIILGVDPQAVAAGAESYAPSRADSIKSAAQDLARLTKAGKFEEAKALSKKYQSAFTKEELEALKIEVTAAEGVGTAGKAFLTADNATGGSLSKTLQVLDAPSQAALASMGNVKQAITGKDAYGNKVDRTDALGRAGKAWSPVGDGHSEAVAALDIDGDGRVTNLRESMGKDPNAGGRFLGALDTLGTVITDPTTYATLGGSNAARQAVKQTVVREVGENTWKKMAVIGKDQALRDGILTAAEHKAIEDAFRKQAQELAQSALAQKSSIASRLSPAARTTRKLAREGDIEGMVQRNMDVLSRQGRAGLKFGIGEQKRTIIPTRPMGLRIPGLQREYDFAADAARQFKPGEVLLSKTPLTVSSVDEAGDIVAELAGGPSRTEGSSLVPTKSIDSIPEMTDEFDADSAKFLLSAADTMAPKAVDDVVSMVDEDGVEQFVLRNADGKAAGILSIADGKVETLYIDETLKSGKRQADRLYQAAADAGHDIATLGADSMTAAGRKAREGYLKRAGQLKGRPGPASTIDKSARAKLAALFPDGKIPAAKADQIYTEGEVLEGIGTVTKVGPDGVHIKPEAAPLVQGAKAKVAKESIGGVIAKSDIGEWVRAAFSPRSGVRSALGEGGERAVYAAESGAEAALNANSRDLALRLKPVRKAAAALQSPPKALYEAVPALDGLRGREALTVLTEGLLDGSVDRQALQVLTDAQEATILRGVDVLQNLGAAPDAAVVSLAGAKHADQLAEILNVKPDTIKAGRDITEVLREQWPTAKNAAIANKQLSEALELPADVKFFEEDIISQTALRSRAAFRGAVQSEMFEKLAQQQVDGKPLVKVIRQESVDTKVPAGWVSMPGIDPTVGRVVGPPEVIHELSRVRDIIINDEALAGLSKFFDQWRRIWATGATSPLPWGTAFHARNATGNAFNAFLAGMTNPARFKEAQGLQRQGKKVAKAMKKTGQSWDEAAKDILGPADLEALTAMRADGTISSGFFHDLDEAFLGQVDPKQGAAAFAMRQAKIADSVPAKAGRKFGDAVENNARIALWLDTYAKTGSKQEAAERVKKYLFDYSDLTAVDRQIKKVMPFWTFTKKNLALQMETLARDPWRVKNMVKAESMLFGGGDGSEPVPEWARESGYRTTSVLGGGAPGTLGIAANIETPLDAAMHTLDPIVQAATLVPGLRDHVPPDYRSDGSEVSRALFGMGGGGPVEFVTFLVENSTGKDMFTGGDVKEGSTLERLTNVIAPMWGKQRGLQGQVTGASKPGMTPELDFLKSFTGINILPLTEKERQQVAYAAKLELQEAIKALEEKGVDVPTYSELEGAGLVPDLRTLEEENERLAKEQEEITNPSQLTGKEQTLTEINAIRALNGEPPLIGGSTGAERGGRRSLFG